MEPVVYSSPSPGSIGILCSPFSQSRVSPDFHILSHRMSIIVVWDLGLQFSQNLSFLFFRSVRHWALFFSAAGMFLVFLLGFCFGAILGASLGLDVAAPDLMASPISLGALGAGAAPSSSSSSSSESFLIEGLPMTLAMVVLALFFFLPWPISSPSDSIVNFIVSSSTAFLGFEVGTLLAGAFLCIPGLVAAAEPYSFFSTTLLEVASSSAT